MINAYKALGKHYFLSPHCPIAVQTVSAATGPQHEHDLTDIMHYHDFSELVIVTAGKGVQVINQVEYPVMTGDVFMLQGFCEHAFRDRRKISLMNIQFSPSLLPLPLGFLRKVPGYNVMFQLEPVLRNQRNFKHRLHLADKELAGLEKMAIRLQKELQKKAIGFEAASVGILLELITFVSRRYSELHNDNNAALVRMGKVISQLESNYTASWTLAQIANVAGMSSNNLLRLFKAATGESPIDYLIKLRLNSAADLLAATDLSITEIAFRCGFNDSNYFSKKFAMLYHMPPRQYRKLH